MLVSRRITDLEPKTRALCEAFLLACKAHNIEVIVTCTLRDNEAQAELYAQGRTKPGKIVTHVQPGNSAHNHGRAFDIVPLRQGKAVWGTTGEDAVLWERIGALGEAQGLTWGGRWHMADFVHFQYDAPKTKIEDLDMFKEQAL